MQRSIALTIIDTVFICYLWMLIINIVSSWFPDLRDNALIRFIRFYTDPYLNLFRRFIPPLGMLDLSPLVAFFALQILEFIVKSIFI